MRNINRKRVQQINNEPSLAQQHNKDETDINNIVSRYKKTGILGDPRDTRRPVFGDFTAVDFQDMQQAIISVDAHFASLPAKIRSMFRNDPVEVIRFVENPANHEAAIKLGLLLDPTGETPDMEEAAKADDEANPGWKKPEPARKPEAPEPT